MPLSRIVGGDKAARMIIPAIALMIILIAAAGTAVVILTGPVPPEQVKIEDIIAVANSSGAKLARIIKRLVADLPR